MAEVRLNPQQTGSLCTNGEANGTHEYGPLQTLVNSNFISVGQ